MSRNQPVYRRPSWAQNEKSYQAHMRNDPAVSRPSSNSPDFGPENFSYDPTYLAQFAAPATIMYKGAHFPQLMQHELENWSFGGAAVCTALDRIDHLGKQATTRGWPNAKTFASLSRHGSIGSPTAAGASDISMSPSPIGSPFILPATAHGSVPASSNTVLTPPSTADSAAGAKTGTVPSQTTLGAIDSPLAGPTGTNTPAYAAQDVKRAQPDLTKLPVELSPRLLPNTPVSGAQTPNVAFDENAWETYMNSFQAELADIRTRAFSRWKGFARTIDRLHTEYGHLSEFHECMQAFESWWLAMKTEMVKYEERIKALRVPDLDKVKTQRAELGMPV